MKMAQAEKVFSDMMTKAGIRVNGDRPFDIQVKNDKFYQRVLASPALGMGESYMDEWWECPALDTFIEKTLRADIPGQVKQDRMTACNALMAKIFNLQTIQRAFAVGKHHYDIGNDLYRNMLDKRMQYTCGYWKDAENLEEAQEAKLELICKKIGLTPGMTILELGCGFGGFARYAAEKYQVSVTGFTVSKKQAEFGRDYCKGLPVDIRLDDYRNASGTYDRILSIGLMEHVGFKNYRTYMELTHRLLKADGLAFIHTIGGNVTTTICNPWTAKYIFPNSVLPSIAALGQAMEGIFVMEDWHNFGEDYDKTLMAWHQNFKAAWPRLRDLYGDRFYRMWEYYLLSCAGAFRARALQLWQIALTRRGRPGPDCRIS
ncbi:MAG TPA: cyclopropane fatty acyl phospholipid synthase [Desulfotignum sp.]|nr:cyclopropane fatty acyl phospholipid synthase [Desulfotignum sp.]